MVRKLTIGVSMKKTYQVVIAGSGPSAISLAEKTAEKGLSTLIVSPSVGKHWTPNYASWFDDLDGLGLSLCIEETWMSPMVWLGNTVVELPFRYAKISTLQLQTLLESRCARNGVQFLCNMVRSVQHQRNSSTVVLSDDQEIDCDVFIDATGTGSFLMRSPSRSIQGYQSAYGILLEIEENPWERGEMSLMDFRIPEKCSQEQQQVFASSPTFLYALPLGKKLVFLEETSLVAKNPLSFEELKRRLHIRMSAMGIEPVRILEEEKCLIPMGGPRPSLQQRTLGFGAAAGLVHPATGYQLAYSLSLCDVVADALCVGLAEGNVEEAVRLAWLQIWPKERIRCWDMYQFGMDVLCSLSTEQTHEFFQAFFSVPNQNWKTFLSGKGTPADISRTMAQVFIQAPFSLQKRLINHAIQPKSLGLVRSVLGL